MVWEQHDATHVRPGRVQHIFINCSQFAMHDINTKAKRGYEASERARHVQNYDAKDNRHKARDVEASTAGVWHQRRALCLVASLRICVCVLSACGYYVPAFTTTPHTI